MLWRQVEETKLSIFYIQVQSVFILLLKIFMRMMCGQLSHQKMTEFVRWAKKNGRITSRELTAIQHGWDNVSIVRPANAYGPYDNFDPENAMVIPSLIHRIVAGENPLNVWGDGSQVRDFIDSHDAANAMIELIKIGYNKPVNLGSGKGVTIKKIVNILCKLEKNLALHGINQNLQVIKLEL